MRHEYLNRLRTDPRAEDARRRMGEKGLTDPHLWNWIIEILAAAPAWYDALKGETRSDRNKRRQKLAAKIEALAAALRDDPKASQLRVYITLALPVRTLKTVQPSQTT